MRDPEMVFGLVTDEQPAFAEPLSFQNEYLGLHQAMYRYDEASHTSCVYAGLKADLASSAKLCFGISASKASPVPTQGKERSA
jgi:hypothetical protein